MIRGLRALYRGTNDFDIVGKFRIGIVISLIAVAVSVVSLFTRELSLGIEFEGGVAWQVEAPGVSVAEARDTLRGEGQADAKIQVIGGDILRVQTEPLEDKPTRAITAKLAELAKVDAEEVSVSDVGPTWGQAVTSKARRALVIFLILIALYIAVRFEWQMALAALVAVAHDIVISVGFYSVFQFEVTPATVIAFLTILGFSLYDTVVVFDKVNENLALSSAGRSSFRDLLNLSMNETLFRSINTTLVSVLPVTSMLVVGAGILGAVTLEEFAIALLVGLISGAYSSVFTAAPMLALLKRNDPRFAARARPARTPASVAAHRDDLEPAAATLAGRLPVSGTSPGTIAARPRKKRRR